MRKTIFANDNCYHIYNRGVDKRDIFLDMKNFKRFIVSMNEFNVVDPIGSLYEKSFKEKAGIKGAKPPIGGLAPQTLSLVEIICWCLNPNHYHFILKQLIDGGISEFMKRLSVGYTCYFNLKHIK